MQGPDPSASPPPAPRQIIASHRLHRFACFALCGFIGWQLYRTEVADPILLALGCGIIVLAALPALRWAGRAEKHMPAFEVLALTAIPFYALPLFRRHAATEEFPLEILTHAAFGIVVFLALANLAHRLTRSRPIRKPLWSAPLFRPGRASLPLVGVYLNAAFLFATNFTQLIPWEFLGPLRALLFGVGIAGTFIATSMWGRGELSIGDRLILSFGLFLQFILTASGLYLISATSLLLLGIIGYVTERRRIPVAVILAGFLFVAILHNGKGEMRRIYWAEARTETSLADLPAFFSEWPGV